MRPLCCVRSLSLHTGRAIPPIHLLSFVYSAVVWDLATFSFLYAFGYFGSTPLFVVSDSVDDQVARESTHVVFCVGGLLTSLMYRQRAIQFVPATVSKVGLCQCSFLCCFTPFFFLLVLLGCQNHCAPFRQRGIARFSVPWLFPCAWPLCCCFFLSSHSLPFSRLVSLPCSPCLNVKCPSSAFRQVQ
jgi:hypothetical protein